MKILILSNVGSGLYKFRKEFIQELIKRKYEVTVSFLEDEFTEKFVELGCKFINTSINRRGTNPIKDYKLLCSYIKIIKREKPDIVLTYTIKPNIYGGIACSKLKKPHIANITGLGTSIENSGIFQKIALLLYRIGFKKTKCVFFQNQHNLDFMKKHRVINNNYRLIPGSGVNVQNYTYQEYPDESEKKIRLLFIGRVMKDKGINELIETARVIRQKYNNVIFEIIGSCEQGYEKIIEEIKKEKTVKYYGRQQDVVKYIKPAHAIVLPSYHEGMSNALLEGAALGRPIIASKIPGCSETFDEGISGIGFEVKNVESMVQAIEKFINMPYIEKKQMGINARKKMEKEFDRNIVINAYEQEINKILGGK